jgi:pimeloyl-ACP methyl ester carboxylesterase
MHETQTAFGPVNFHQIGTGDDTIILLHGAAAGPETLQRLATQLARHNRRILIPALAGYGLLEMQPGTNALTVNLAIARAIADQATGSQIGLFGHSMGGLIALMLALEMEKAGKTVTAVAFYEPILHDILDPDNSADQAAITWDQQIINALTAGIAAGTPDEAVSAFISAWNNVAWAQLPQKFQQQLTAQAERLAWETTSLPKQGPCAAEVAKLRSPVLLLRGSQSPAFSVAVFAAFYAARPASCCHILADLGHLAPMRDPVAVSATLDPYFVSKGM